MTFLSSVVHDAFAFGIERDDGDRIPVPRVSRPASRIGLTSLGIDLVSAGQDVPILASVTLSGAYVADGAVAVLMVVPGHELTDPTASGIHVDKTLARELRPILGGAEERLDSSLSSRTESRKRITVNPGTRFRPIPGIRGRPESGSAIRQLFDG
jgi:hypothetical protein